MELNVTEFVRAADPRTYSASIAEMGDCAGPATWQAACNADFQLLQTPEQFDAFRRFVRESGGWNDEECAAFTTKELNALCIQWVSGDMRECFTDDECQGAPIDWARVESRQAEGQAPSNIGRGDDGSIWFSL